MGKEQRSPAGEWAQKQYKSKRWAKVRKRHLVKHPYCQCPHHTGKQVQATVVDHKTPHRSDPRLFWDERNLQSMTKDCHDIFKQSQERGGAGFEKGNDERGRALVNRMSSWFKQWGET